MGISTPRCPSPGLVKNKPSKLKPALASLPRRKHRHRLPLIKRRHRVVHFNTDANKVQERERTDPDTKCTLFWTRDERDDILANNQRLALEYRRSDPLSVKKANFVFDKCRQDLNLDDSSDEDEFDEPEDQEEDESFVAATSMEVPTQVRGLECGFMLASKRYRRTHVQRVLQWQKRLKECDEKSQLLSARAVRSSRPSRLLARIIADGDSMQSKSQVFTGTRRVRCRMMPSW